MRLGKEPLQIPLGALYVRAEWRELPALRKAVDMRVHRESGHAEGLRHHHRGRLVPHAGQLLQLRKTARHFAAVFLNYQLREPPDRLRLSRGQSAGAHVRVNLLNREPHHFLRGVGFGEEPRGLEVDAFIGALRGQQHRNQQGVCACMVQRHQRFRIEPGEMGINKISSFSGRHIRHRGAENPLRNLPPH